MNIADIISHMTLEEKASLCSGADFWHTKAVERLGIEPVMVSDGPHGLRKQDDKADHLGVNESIKAVCFPAACASTASFDRDMIYKIGEAIGDSCQHEQVSVNLGPAINIKRSPLCGRNFEYLSEDPYLAGELAASLARGIQSRHVGVSVKHFLANNQEHRRMSSSSNIDDRTLREIYLPAFENVVKTARPWTVMCSYNKINGTLASENKRFLTDILRGEWGFDGYVMSDWGAVSDRVAALRAGLDLEMPSSNGTNDARIVEAVKRGELDESVLDEAVRRILTVNERYLSHAAPETPWDLDAQHEQARAFAAQSMVLLKNKNGVLPLKEGTRVAVIGRFAKKPRYQGGGSSHINAHKVTSLFDEWGGKPNVTFLDGYTLEGEGRDVALMLEAEKAAAAADVAVIMAGLPDSFESEGYDRAHIDLPKGQNELISRVAAVNPNTVVVLHNGSPVAMPWIDEVAAVLEAYLGGQAVGGAVADVLSGKVNPSGRLPETFPLRIEDTPCYLNFGGEGNSVTYTEGVFVGYRYYTKVRREVYFPFGYGLSYTHFTYDNLRCDRQKLDDTQTLTVSVDVTNAGETAGAEVVQLYVADRESSVFRPVRELKGFEKVFLAPHETKTVTFTLGKRAFAYWNTELDDWYVESGLFAVQICANANQVILEKEVEVVGTAEAPAHFDVNSVFMDIMRSPKAMKVLEPLIGDLYSTMAGGSDGSADSAISADMLNAMLLNMPLHGLLSFGGKLTWDGLIDIVKRMNEA